MSRGHLSNSRPSPDGELPEAGLVSCATMLASPFFAAIPWLARQHPALGRAALPVMGLLNTIWTTALLGPESGVAVFAYPCIVLALLCWRERLTLLAVLGLGLAAQQLVLRWPWVPLSGLNAEAQAALVAMNGASVGMLLAFLVLMGARHARTIADAASDC